MIRLTINRQLNKGYPVRSSFGPDPVQEIRGLPESLEFDWGIFLEASQDWMIKRLIVKEEIRLKEGHLEGRGNSRRFMCSRLSPSR